MHRTTLLVLAVLLPLVAAMPTASAAASHITLQLPEGPLEGDATTPLLVRLDVTDFMCHEERDFVVTLHATTTPGVRAALETTTVHFPVERRSYLIDDYAAETTIGLTLRAIEHGRIDIQAHFQADNGPCFVPGGFQPSNATATRDVTPAPEPRPTPPTPDEPTPPTPDEPTPDEPAPTGPDPRGCAPSKTCGYISDYQTPHETSKDTPGPGLLALTAALGLALTMRRRK